jgi:acyl-CoA dehydrogenase
VVTLLWFIGFFAGTLALTYHRVSLLNYTVAFSGAFVLFLFLGDPGFFSTLFLLLILGVLWFMNHDGYRQEYITAQMLEIYRRLLPSMSDTEREALEAGTVWWDGELFSGAPDWSKLLDSPRPVLSDEERAFIDGPVEELCRMLDEWNITHERGDLSPEVWEFLKSKGFFAMIIPKSFGGLEFSALAHSEVLIKVASRSPTACSTIAVPNSLGPAELLLHYGTDEQKQRYLPGLADGTEIPCFALTSPRAGSDAASIPDVGIVCRGQWEGEEVIGLRLSWDKRYITLAPIATVLGLAFKMLDPDHLLGDRDDLGITCALIPTDLPGIETGRRHFPLNIPFLNGPTRGQDVFVPLEAIIGGPEMAGQGWRMLVELLSVGRCITLPSNATGGAKAGAYAAGAYTRIRKQFNMSVADFEGVQEALARIGGLTYIMDASRRLTAGAVDQGHRPSVPSAILKYHCTEMGRQVANDAMDVHGGKAICLGPKNYIARSYQSVPIAITVEGANILTRSLIIFGQGAVRCHPYVLEEMQAVTVEDPDERLHRFDAALFGHVGYAIRNASRSFTLALSQARLTRVPIRGATRRYYQHINRFAASFALIADVAMLTLGGALKKKEGLSARLGDMLSSMYLASMVLKNYEDQGRPEEDLPLVEWSCRFLIYRLQEQMHGFLRNFPNPWIATGLRFLVFPRGRTYFSPADQLANQVADLITHPGPARDRLCAGVYSTSEPGNPLGLLQDALIAFTDAGPAMARLRDAERQGIATHPHPHDAMRQAAEAGAISAEDHAQLLALDEQVMALIAVDDFDGSELGTQAGEPAATKPRRKTTRRRKAAVKERKDEA